MHRHTACGFYRSCFNEYFVKYSNEEKKIKQFRSCAHKQQKRLIDALLFTGLLVSLFQNRLFALSPAAVLLQSQHLFLYVCVTPKILLFFLEEKYTTIKSEKNQQQQYRTTKISSN